MSFTDNRQHSSGGGQGGSMGSLQATDEMGDYAMADQLPFSATADLSAGGVQAPTSQVGTRAVTRVLSAPVSAPGITRQLDYTPLPEPQTGTLMFSRSTTTSLREPVVIRGDRGRRSAVAVTTRPTTRRRMVVNMVVTVLLVIVVVATLLAVIPVGGGHTVFSSLTGNMNQVKSNSSNTGMIAQQAATATAVTQDGYDASNGQSYAGLPTAPPSWTSTYNPFTYGQCTYWADYYYHSLTKHWVPWVGNAYDWAYGAQRFGWVVSAQPKVYSIIVMQPGVQYAGPYGHVAVVVGINANGSVVTSNMNWTGNFGQVSLETFWPGGSTRFVWYPGT